MSEGIWIDATLAALREETARRAIAEDRASVVRVEEAEEIRRLREAHDATKAELAVWIERCQTADVRAASGTVRALEAFEDGIGPLLDAVSALNAAVTQASVELRREGSKRRNSLVLRKGFVYRADQLDAQRRNVGKAIERLRDGITGKS